LREDRTSNRAATAFAAEVARLHAAGVPGRSGRLRELFDFLADRGAHTAPATQAEIAAAVFNQSETDADDATVRVYVHRLRKRLEDHYRDHPPAPGAPQLDIPSGIYALQLVGADVVGQATGSPASAAPLQRRWLLAAALALVAAFMGGWLLNQGESAPSNAVWDPLLASDRPVLLVLGDYYLFGEIDPVAPDEGRLIRDFRVNSPEELLVMQEAEPERYGMAEDVGLNYLPFQSAFAVERIAPLLASGGKQVQIIAASELTSDMLNTHDVVYVGLLSGMGLLEEITFAGSSLRIGENYDEIIDRETRQLWSSDEARRIASPAFYRDFAYVSRYRAPGGGLVTVVASERVTGLRGIGAIVANAALADELDDAADKGDFEALYQITGQQGADLSDRLILARARR
jgi:hypothetical protein